MCSSCRKDASLRKARRRRSRAIRASWRPILVTARPAGCWRREPAMPEPILAVNGLRAGYGTTEILRGVDLTVRHGEIVAVLGANGAGKSTLNQAISGLVRPWSGAIRFADAAIERERPAAIVARGPIHVAAGPLAGGEQQLLAIGRGLMPEPKLLILDEPSLGLSPLLVEELFALIKDINADGIALLLVEQNVVQSLEVAQRAYILDNGLFVLQGSAADIRNDPDLKRAYLGM